jgi:ribosomal-protein-alanine N-acetyltransferase
MSAITRPLTHSASGLRPFDVGQDLKEVADLVETCFAETLDVDGRRYVQQMHAAARNPRYLRWAANVADHVSMPLTGYVWEEHGRIVGNLSLIPFTYQGQRCYLIANVAVDPGYRRRGIARDLTQAALDHIRQRGASAAWLHVREENQAAQNLYLSMGFKEQARRTTWEGGWDTRQDPFAGPVSGPPPGVKIVPRSSLHWPRQRSWLKRLYPPQLTWHMPFNLLAMQPGLFGLLYRLLSAAQIHHWSAVNQDGLLGVLTWQPHLGHADHLWLAASEKDENEELAITSLLPHARRRLASRPRLVLDFPAGRGVQAFRQAGFSVQQTLIWMSVPFS